MGIAMHMMKSLLYIALLITPIFSYADSKCFKIDYVVVGGPYLSEIVCSQNYGTAWDELSKRFQKKGKTITRINMQ